MAAKSPAFQWYAADYLSDERVICLTLEQEGAYVRLLNYCWREGSIPAKAELCVPMCKYADVKVIKAALALFVKSPTQPGRLVHKRLEEEREKQEAFRERQAANGKRGGRPQKPTSPPDENPEETHSKGLGFSGETQTKPTESSSSSTSSSTTTTLVEEPSSLRSEEPAPASVNPSPEPPPVPAPAQTSTQIAILPEKPGKKRGEKKPEEPKMLFADSQLAAPLALAAHLSAKGYPDADAGYYRRKISDWSAGENADGKPVQRTERGWATTVTGWLDRDKAKGCLMRQGATSNQANHHVSQTERRQQAVNDAAALRQVMPYASGFTSSLGMAPPKETPQA